MFLGVQAQVTSFPRVEQALYTITSFKDVAQIAPDTAILASASCIKKTASYSLNLLMKKRRLRELETHRGHGLLHCSHLYARNRPKGLAFRITASSILSYKYSQCILSLDPHNPDIFKLSQMAEIK